MNTEVGPTPSARGSDDRARAVRAMLGWDRMSETRTAESAGSDPGPSESRPRRSALVARVSRWLLVSLVIVFALGCDRSRGVVLWHAYQDAEAEALAATVARWNAEHPETTVELVGVPYKSFGDKLTSAIPGGNGPDLFIYPQDRIGDWAEAQIIEPLEFWVDDARAGRFSDAALEAMAYKGSLWGLPMAVKSLALFYRPDIIATPPATTDELLAFAPTMRKRDGYAIAYANEDLYGHAPWLFGFGGRILDGDALSIATPESAAAMAFARELVAKGATPQSAEGPLVATLFNEGRAAMAISGPWFLQDIAAGVPYKIAVLPTVSATGKPAAPFLGAEGLLMSARAKDKDAAFAVMDALTSDVAAIERARTAKQVVPNVRAYDDAAVAADPVLVAFRAQLPNTVPMPIHPAMRMVWTPYKTALGEVLSGRAEAGPQLLSVEREVAGYLAGASK